MFAPGGFASLIMMNLRVASFGKLRQLLVPYLLLFVTGAVALAGGGAMIEMVYHLQLNEVAGPEMTYLGVPLNAAGRGSWIGAALVLLVGAVAVEVARRRFVPVWGRIQGEIQREIKRREAAA
ncbi:MAG: branched-chain amino acid ABC transporter permease, partial [Rubrivivax sp.]